MSHLDITQELNLSFKWFFKWSCSGIKWSELPLNHEELKNILEQAIIVEKNGIIIFNYIIFRMHIFRTFVIKICIAIDLDIRRYYIRKNL